MADGTYSSGPYGGVPQMLPYFIAAKGPLGWFRLRL